MMKMNRSKNNLLKILFFVGLGLGLILVLILIFLICILFCLQILPLCLRIFSHFVKVELKKEVSVGWKTLYEQDKQIVVFDFDIVLDQIKKMVGSSFVEDVVFVMSEIVKSQIDLTFLIIKSNFDYLIKNFMKLI